MKHYKYYTPKLLADALLKLIPERKYKRVIDICCGSWNLLKAAYERYPEAEFVGVDIDKGVGHLKMASSLFYNEDGRTFALNHMEKKEEKFDLILSNPPFGYLKEEERVFFRSTKKCIDKTMLTKRFESEMVQANFLLAGEGAVLLFILPSTFVEGISNRKVRKEIARKYHINALIKLPEDTFGNASISTYAIIVENVIRREKKVNIYKMEHYENVWMERLEKTVDYEKIENGTWINEDEEESGKLDIYRGKISSSDFVSTKGLEVLHCSNTIIDDVWIPSRRSCAFSVSQQRKARPGDIIINRIGKYAGHWWINHDDILISDCLLVITNVTEGILDKIETISENGKLPLQVYGVTTKYVTAKDVKKILA